MQVTLRKDSWHARLQGWTFGSVSWRQNLCPYFWLTVFCIIVSPFVLVGKLVAEVCGAVIIAFESLLERLDGVLTRWEDENDLKEAQGLSLANAYIYDRLVEEYYRGLGSKPDRYYRKIMRVLRAWTKINPGARDLFKHHEPELESEWVQKRKELEAAEARKKQKLMSREAFLNRIAMATRRLVHAVAVLIVVGLFLTLGWALYMLCIHFFDMPWKMIASVLGFIVMVSLCVVTVIGLGCWIADLLGQRRLRVRSNGSPGLLRLYMRAAKENYCPRIEWRDE